MSRIDVAHALALARAAIAGGGDAVLAVVVRAPDPALVGARLAWAAGRHHGSLGGTASDAEARALLAAAPDVPRCHAISGGIELYVERWSPPAELVIVGAGHVARPLAAVGRLLDYRVTVLDDRPDLATRERFPDADRLIVADPADLFAHVAVGRRTSLVLVTRGHRYDYDALRALAAGGAEPAYVGMIGSRRRVRAAFEQLAAEGVPADWLARIHAPLGLDIGAESPAEIAIAVGAELVLTARGGSGRPLSERAEVVRRLRSLATATPDEAR